MVDIINAGEFGPGDFNHVYYRNDHKKPVLIKDEVADWAATQKWNPEFLDCLLGRQEVTIKFLEDGVLSLNDPEKIEVKTLPFSEARQYICEDGNYYISQVAIKHPLLSRVIGGKSSNFSRLGEDLQQPCYLNDISKQCYVTNLWFGGNLCKTPLHFDDKENFFVQIFGEKRFLLFPPSQTDYLYQAHGETFSHMSRVDVFDPDKSKFPRFAEAKYTEVIVKPGDMLYIPKDWWHAVDTLETSISVNFWWTNLIRHIKLQLSQLYNRIFHPSNWTLAGFV